MIMITYRRDSRIIFGCPDLVILKERWHWMTGRSWRWPNRELELDGRVFGFWLTITVCGAWFLIDPDFDF